MMRTSHIISLVASLCVLAFVVFIAIVGIKAGIDGTSFVDAWNAIFGITGTPTDTPVTPDNAEDVAETVETVTAFLK